MEFNLLAILAGILISVGHSFELFGFFFRALGAMCGKPSVGYSSHVQIATISRLSTLVAMPIVGFLLDKGVGIETILLVPISSLTIFILLSLIQISISYRKEMLMSLFKKFVKVVSRVEVIEKVTEHDDKNKCTLPQHILRKIFISGFVSFFIITGGLFSIYLVSSANLNYRAMILQSAPIFTAVGTLISVVFFDSAISNALDSYKFDMSLIRTIVKARLYAALILFLIFILFFLKNTYI